MKIRILGTSSGMPSLEKHLSAIHVQTANHSLLLDCGEGCTRQLLKYKISPEDLDAIFISHYHPDHVSGIFMLLQRMYLAGRTKELSIFLPEQIPMFENTLNMFYTFPQKFGFAMRLIPISEANLTFPEITAEINDHLLGYADIIQARKLPNVMAAYSIRISSPAGDFVYSSDISSTESIANLLNGANTVLIDAGHPEKNQILRLKDMNITRVLLTHDSRPELLQHIKENPHPLFEEAIEGKIYEV